MSLSGKGENTKWVMATAREHLTALGWRMHGSSQRFPLSPLSSCLQKLKFTPAQIKQLAGNSMHLRTQMCFMFYALGHIMLRVPKSDGFKRQMTWGDFEDSQDLRKWRRLRVKFAAAVLILAVTHQCRDGRCRAKFVQFESSSEGLGAACEGKI